MMAEKRVQEEKLKIELDKKEEDKLMLEVK